MITFLRVLVIVAIVFFVVMLVLSLVMRGKK